jgi:8-hydroxy-5-deazaflavin:NADPH oxidoreductase
VRHRQRHVRSNLAKAALAHGYSVVLSNSHVPDSMVGLVAELGPGAGAATPGKLVIPIA